MANKPNSNPFKGNTPKNETAAVKPMTEVKITEPQLAQPMPKTPEIIAKIPKPEPVAFKISCLFLK